MQDPLRVCLDKGDGGPHGSRFPILGGLTVKCEGVLEAVAALAAAQGERPRQLIHPGARVAQGKGHVEVRVRASRLHCGFQVGSGSDGIQLVIHRQGGSADGVAGGVGGGVRHAGKGHAGDLYALPAGDGHGGVNGHGGGAEHGDFPLGGAKAVLIPHAVLGGGGDGDGIQNQIAAALLDVRGDLHGAVREAVRVIGIGGVGHLFIHVQGQGEGVPYTQVGIAVIRIFRARRRKIRLSQDGLHILVIIGVGADEGLGHKGGLAVQIDPGVFPQKIHVRRGELFPVGHIRKSVACDIRHITGGHGEAQRIGVVVGELGRVCLVRAAAVDLLELNVCGLVDQGLVCSGTGSQVNAVDGIDALRIHGIGEGHAVLVQPGQAGIEASFQPFHHQADVHVLAHGAVVREADRIGALQDDVDDVPIFEVRAGLAVFVLKLHGGDGGDASVVKADHGAGGGTAAGAGLALPVIVQHAVGKADVQILFDVLLGHPVYGYITAVGSVDGVAQGRVFLHALPRGGGSAGKAPVHGNAPGLVEVRVLQIAVGVHVAGHVRGIDQLPPMGVGVAFPGDGQAALELLIPVAEISQVGSPEALPVIGRVLADGILVGQQLGIVARPCELEVRHRIVDGAGYLLLEEGFVIAGVVIEDRHLRRRDPVVHRVGRRPDGQDRGRDQRQQHAGRQQDGKNAFSFHGVSSESSSESNFRVSLRDFFRAMQARVTATPSRKAITAERMYPPASADSRNAP